MKKLTSIEIEKFASAKGVKRTAVENFLSSLDTSIGIMGNTMNAQMDARMYKWNTATIRAIEAGIRHAASKPEVKGKFGVSSSKKITAANEKSFAELRKSVKEHNDKIMGIGTKKKIGNKVYTLHAVSPYLSELVSHGNAMVELGKIKEHIHGVEPGKYGYELWVR